MSSADLNPLFSNTRSVATVDVSTQCSDTAIVIFLLINRAIYTLLSIHLKITYIIDCPNIEVNIKMQHLNDELKAYGQEQVLKFFDDLTEEQKTQLKSSITEVDWKKLNQIYQAQVLMQIEGGKVKQASKIDDNLLKELPSDCIEGTTRTSKEDLDRYHSIGLESISQGKVAALLLAGGQGTRLGVNYPKGMYEVGSPSKDSLFQLQAKRILDLIESSQVSHGQKGEIIWYIMTSEATMIMTKDYFESHDFFGLDRERVVFFEQNTLPCFSFDGKVLLDAKHRLTKSPDGNGGLYEALHEKKIINHMQANGVEYVHVYCVDNILVRVCDPTFMGYCIAKQVDAGAKVVEKTQPEEAVGIICKVNDKFKVIEYSEISESIAQRRNPASGKLVFNAGNICEHFFRVSFLETIKEDKVLRYHIALKKIPHVSLETGERVNPDKPNGIKLEKFIFDVFELTEKFAAWEVKREDEFSPIKNAPGTEKDNPETALKALLRAYELGSLKV